MKETKEFAQAMLEPYLAHLREGERCPGTLEKYGRDILAFCNSLAPGQPVTKEAVIGFKEALRQERAVTTVNAMLVAVNGFLTFCGLAHCRVKLLKQQRKLFRDNARELTREEYQRLVDAANRQGRERLALLLQAACATGIRVSEVQYLTVEAARAGKAEIALKGKIRTILIPGKLAKALLRYAKKQNTVSGEIFLTRNGGGISRKQIWAEMKSLCKAAGVEAGKVFPHNLRHLFARCFYQACKDIAKLADVLGHASVETTRVYLISTGEEHARTLARLHLVI